MEDQLQVFLSNIDPKLANQPSSRIQLGVGDCPEETGIFEEGYTFFDGYLIGKVIISIPEETPDGEVIDPSSIADRIQKVYHATSEGKIIVYEYVDANADIHGAKIYEIKNVNNFISKYPQLAKEIGLPKTPLQPVYSLDESITGKI